MTLKETAAGAGDTAAALEITSAEAFFSNPSAERPQSKVEARKWRNAPRHLIGKPRVLVENNGTSTRVAVVNAPWGFGEVERVYLHKPLHPRSVAAEKDATALRKRLAELAWAEQDRRDRRDAAQLETLLKGVFHG